MSTKSVTGLVVAGVAALVVVLAGFGSFYKINEIERGVVLTNGAFSGIAEPGLAFKIPFVQSVIQFSMEQQTTAWHTNPMVAYSRDQQPASLVVSVNWQLDPTRLAEAYATYGANAINVIEQTIVATRVPETLKEVFGRFSAEEAIQDRTRLNQEISDAVFAALSATGSVIIPLGIQLEDIAFSAAYENAVEARMTAQVEVERTRQNAEREAVQAQIAVIQAQGRADAVVAEATARAAATRLAGEAEAAAIEAKGQALRENPELVALITAEAWNGVLPTQMIPTGTVPFLNLGAPLAR